MRSTMSFAVVACAVLCGSATARAGVIGPTPYLSFAGNSPFAALSFATFHLENFEDGFLNTPGATASPGWLVLPPQVLDSVDEDDGLINGSGASAKSFYSGNTETVLTIIFSAAVLGQLPTHAGMVWTDLGITNNGQPYGFGLVTFEVFGPGNVLLGSIGPTAAGDGQNSGQTAEDRFFGATFAGGIESIRMTATSRDWEIDHVQYGIIPAPGAAALLGLGGPMAARRRRA